MLETILFVDDEPKILEAYRRTLRKHFNVVTAEGGHKALALMASEGPFPVVVSDMKMPEMNGTELLSEVKTKYPNTINIMLTGNADQQTAAEAINSVGVFHFLNKPCPPDKMTATLTKAIKAYEANQSEQALLESTVKGSINALVEILSIANPKVFGRATMIRQHVLSCAKSLGIAINWELEATALLSQIGIVTLPEELLERVLAGTPLSEADQISYRKHPEVAAQLINRIPRLESISEAIRCQNIAYDGSNSGSENDSNDNDNGNGNSNKISGDNIPFAARLLKPILDFTACETAKLSIKEAISHLQSQSQHYDPDILAAVIKTMAEKEKLSIKEIPISRLTENMRIASDVFTLSGVLLVAKDQEVSASLIIRLRNFIKNNEITKNVFVYIDDDEQ